MKYPLLLVFLFPFIVFPQLTPGQEAKIDSFEYIIETTTDDSILVNALVAWDNIIYISNPKLDFELNEKIEELCEKNLIIEQTEDKKRFFLLAQSSALNIMGINYESHGNNNDAIIAYTKSLAICEAINSKRGMANALTNIGNVYSRQEDTDKAMENYQKSLAISEEIKNDKLIGLLLNNIGTIYQEQGTFTKAVNCFNRSLLLAKKTERLVGIASSLINLGTVYRDLGDSAKSNRDNSLAQKEYATAMSHYEESMLIQKKIGNKEGIAITYNHMANIYGRLENNVKVIEYSTKALELAKESNIISVIRDASSSLSDAYKINGQYALALEMYILYVEMNDSITSEKNQEEIIHQEYKYEYEKQAAADSVKAIEAQKINDAQLAAQKAQLEQEETQRYALIGGVGLLLLFGGFMYNRFRITSKQKDVIEKQKGVVEKQKNKVQEAHNQLEEKNREITDSIAYAKRIQSAILPPIKLVKEYLKDSFVFYKPKDVVAGDFYWLFSKANDGSTIFAAADCTGHGVPGAMVSVVCNSALNRAVKEFGLSDPGAILSKTRDLVIEEFEKSDEEVKDGMDIALCSLKGNTLKYAGAYNPLWIIRKGASEVEEIKAHKQAIGLVENPTSFPTHTLELNLGDTFYIFSDGYVDQFGGEKGKKYKAPNFRKLLLSIQLKSLTQQHQIIDATFEDWKGDLEQIDDVCVLGVRI